MTKNITLFILVLNAFSCFSQNDSIMRNKLENVIVVVKKKENEVFIGKKSIKITEKQLVKNPVNLTNLLRYNSPIVFRDYGNGGVSTARFRGTSATNTLVLWNGIPINSFGSGQTDFNSLSSNLSDEIKVNSGGSSAENGSGAIGGTISLNDNLSFREHKKVQVFTSYGSFNTTSNFLKVNISDEKWSIKLGSAINYSTNDYTYVDDRYTDTNGNLWVNENGTYKNHGINFVLGYKVSEANKLSFYTTGYYGDRLFSNGLPNPSSGNERNEDFNQRNLLKWEYGFNKFKQTINVSYLTEEYRYYDDKETDDFVSGSSKNYNIDYQLKYLLNNYIALNTSLLYQNISGVLDKERNVKSFSAGVSYIPNKKLSSNLVVRKEDNSDYEVPLSLSFGVEYEALNNFKLKASFSKDYRVPTFNELYWPIVGNLNLMPETSKQGEIGIALNTKNITFSSALFYIKTRNKILWLPTGGSNLWSPKNVEDVVNKGVETYVNYATSLKGIAIDVTINYLYVVAQNTVTNGILPYVPRNLLNINLDLVKDRFKLYTQTLYQTKVFTNEINLDFYSLNPVFVNNVGIGYQLLKSNKKQIDIGFKVNNVFNEVYYFSNLRPMPGTNYNLNINYKF